MGIQSSSATFTRYYVPDIVTEDFWGTVDEKLKAGAFGGCDESRDVASGFTIWEDFFDPAFDSGSYHKGDYVAFHFRLDQRKVPAIINKQYTKQAVQKYRAENGGKWPSRQDKLAIQEEVQDWLLKRVLPQPSAFDVVWNPSARWMILGTTSLKMLDAFLELFEGHFRVYPIPLYHARWALHGAPIEPQLKDALGSLVNVESVHAIDEGRFLGYEFLTWLWFYTEHAEGKLRCTPELDVQVELGERLVLTLPGEGREKVVCTTQANALSEARVALQQGKMVEEIQIQMRAGENDYQVTLDSTLQAFKGLKTPKQLPEFGQEDPDGRFLERMFFLEEASTIINALYATYLRMRLGGAWETDALPVLKEWIGGGPAGA
ncbi:MAG: recombination-associated protein RdgC [Syntrophobacteraceae bacterium]|jgi:hypothetical protein|nr:recombination-associated protein RdgC [Syntrophobacteraceae bacterium]